MQSQAPNKLKTDIPPEEKLSVLRAAYTLLEAKIPHGHGLLELELLVSPYDIFQAAHVICLKHPYTPVDIRLPETGYWPGHLKHLQPLSTVRLRHKDDPSCYDTNEPPDIYLHAESVFHFNIQDPAATISDPNPPDERSSRLLYPALIALCNSIIDTIHEPPSLIYHLGFYLDYLGSLDNLCGYTVGVNRFTKKKGKLIGSCGWLLQMVKEENRPFLSRLLLDLPKHLSLQTSAFERVLIKDARCKREGLPFQCPVVLPIHTSDTFVPTKRALLREIRKFTAMNPLAASWRFSPRSFRPLFRLATRR